MVSKTIGRGPIPRTPANKNMIKSNNEIIKCPKCGSTNIVAIQPFDYRKGCNDCKHVFSSNPHN